MAHFFAQAGSDDIPGIRGSLVLSPNLGSSTQCGIALQMHRGPARRPLGNRIKVRQAAVRQFNAAHLRVGDTSWGHARGRGRRGRRHRIRVPPDSALASCHRPTMWVAIRNTSRNGSTTWLPGLFSFHDDSLGRIRVLGDPRRTSRTRFLRQSSVSDPAQRSLSRKCRSRVRHHWSSFFVKLRVVPWTVRPLGGKGRIPPYSRSRGNFTIRAAEP